MAALNGPGTRAFSLSRQSVRRDDGIEHQKRSNRNDIDDHGWTLAFEEADNNVSATTARGEGTAYRKMLDAWDAGLFDVLVVTKVARLVRNAFSVDLEDILKRKMFVSVGGMVFDLSVPQARNMFAQQALTATFEVEEMADRRAPVISAARAAGHPKAGIAPYGFRYVDAAERKMIQKQTGTSHRDVRRYEVVPGESAVIKEIATRVLAQETLAFICRDFAARGRRTRSGAMFGSTSLARAVLNPAVVALIPPIKEAGKQDPRKLNPDECAPGTWDPILTKDRWLAVRGVLLADVRRTNGGSTARKHLLGSLMTCGMCGLPMQSGYNRHNQRIYRCSSQKHNGRLAHVIDAYVEELVIARLAGADAQDLLRKRDDFDVPQLRGERAEVLRRMAEVRKALFAGDLTADQMAAPMEGFRRDLARIDSTLAKAQATDPLADLVGIADVRSAWTGLSLDRKRAVVRELMVITVWSLGPGGRVRSVEDMRTSMGVAWRRTKPDLEEWPFEDENPWDVEGILLPSGDVVPLLGDDALTGLRALL